MNILKPVAVVDEAIVPILKKIVGSSAYVVSSSSPRWKKNLMLFLSEQPVSGWDDSSLHAGPIVVSYDQSRGEERELTYGSEEKAIIQFHYFGEETFKVSTGGDTVPFRLAGESVWPAIAFAVALGFNLVKISQVFTDKDF